MTREITLPIKLRPMQHQIMAEADKIKYYVAVIHRGFGKTFLAHAWLIRNALKFPNHKFAYIAPEKTQAKKVVWDQFKKDMHPIPGIVFNETELVARLPNGSTIYLEGAENPDRIRGNHYKGVVMDEVGDMPNDMWDLVVFPALQAHKGKALFIGTPKGPNNFKKLYERSFDDEFKQYWGSCLYNLYQTDAFDEESRREKEINYRDEPERFAQEYMCSWDANLELETAVYGRALNQLRDRGQLIEHSLDPLKPVYVGIDLGLVDNTCMWFAQYDITSEKIVVMDYYENKNQDMTFYLNELNKKNYIYAKIYLPHDAIKRSMSTSVNVLDIFKAHGFKTQVLPKTNSVIEDVQAVKTLLQKTWFNTATTGDGLRQLRDYGAKLDRKTGQATQDLKHSDCADAFRYLMLGISSEATRLTGQQKSSNVIQQRLNPLERFREFNSKRGPGIWR